LNLLKMAKEGLLYGLRSAFQAARKTHNAVHKEGLQVRSGSGWRAVGIDVIPMAVKGRTHYLVMFTESRGGKSRKTSAEAAWSRKIAKPGRKSQLDFLERELAASREYLQSIIQELEAANEELQSANEEVLSSNEELQSTNEELDTAKEELQSTNEELNTVNEELHSRNEELSRVNSDLVNLLGSVQIAIVIVAADLRIRRFTPMAEKVLNLIPADIDRLIGHINPNIVGANLEQLIGECIDTITPIEREVQDAQGHWYSLRIRPYRSVETRSTAPYLPCTTSTSRNDTRRASARRSRSPRRRFTIPPLLSRSSTRRCAFAPRARVSRGSSRFPITTRASSVSSRTSPASTPASSAFAPSSARPATRRSAPTWRSSRRARKRRS